MIKKKSQFVQNNNDPSNIYRIYILGAPNTGKTELLYRIINEPLPEDLKRVKEMNLRIKNMEIGKESVKIFFHDVNGSEKSKWMQYRKKGVGAILVFDLLNDYSFKVIKEYYHEFSFMSVPNSYIILVGNKLDLCESSKKQVTEKEINLFIKSRNIPYFEVSAINNFNVQETFTKFVEEIHRRVKYKMINLDQISISSSSVKNDKKKGKEQERESLDAEISEIKNEKQLKEKEIARLTMENASFRESIEILKLTLSETEKRDESHKQKIEELQKKLQEKKNDLISSSNKIDIISAETLSKYKKIETIGSSPSSEVVKVSRGEFLALKVLDFDDEIEEDDEVTTYDFECQKKLISEYEFINNLDHPNIVKTHGICFGDSEHPPSILFEYCPFNLRSSISNLNTIEKVSIIYEISEAMEHVHASGLIHRNLKPENVLLDEGKHVKLSDFGIATSIDLGTLTKTRTRGIVKLDFMAPEMLCENSHYNEKVDVYSFGAVMLFVLTAGKFPKIGLADKARGRTSHIPDSVNDVSREIITRCWAAEPDERPSFAEISARIRECSFMLIDGIEGEIEPIRTNLSI